MAHHQQNISKGVLSYFVDIILAIELAAFLQIQPFIMQVGNHFWQESANECLKFFRPFLDYITEGNTWVYTHSSWEDKISLCLLSLMFSLLSYLPIRAHFGALVWTPFSSYLQWL